MNTTEKGNKFEDKVYGLIQNALSTEQLGLIESQCKVFPKKGYYSKDREASIIFDLTIELWPPNSENYSLLYIIECKNYNHKVPIDDLEEFYSKIDQVSGANRKGVFITNNSFQKSAYNFAKNKGIMLIEVLSDDSLNFIHHKTTRLKIKGISTSNKFEEKLEKLILNLFKSEKSVKGEKIRGLKILSKRDFESITLEIISNFDKDLLEYGKSINLQNFQNYLTEKFNLKFNFEEEFEDDTILGSYDNENKLISISKSVVDTIRFPFVFAHEIGHFFLHKELKVTKGIYNNFKDSEYNFLLSKHELKNPKQWIEWQANQFAACLLMPELILIRQLIRFQINQGIRNKGQIFVDNQQVNQKLFNQTIAELSLNLMVSKTSVIYRMKDLGIIIFAKNSNWENYF